MNCCGLRASLNFFMFADMHHKFKRFQKIRFKWWLKNNLKKRLPTKRKLLPLIYKVRNPGSNNTMEIYSHICNTNFYWIWSHQKAKFWQDIIPTIKGHICQILSFSGTFLFVLWVYILILAKGSYFSYIRKFI